MISWPTEPAGANISRMKVHCVLCAALLAAGVSVQTAPDSDALFAAIRRGTAAEVERTLKVGADANAVDADGVPALMAAALFGDARLVDVLLSHHADPNAKGPGGTTALMWAVPDVQKVRTLLAHGAAVNARTETERTALLVAASYPRTSALLRLLSNTGPTCARRIAAARRRCRSPCDPPTSTSSAFWSRPRPGSERALCGAGAARRLARYDRPTTDYLMSKAAAPVHGLLEHGRHLAARRTRLARWIDLGRQRQRDNAAQYGTNAAA